MLILSSTPGSTAYITVLLTSTLYWLRVAAGATETAFPAQLTRVYQNAVPEAELFCRQYKIPVKDFRGYAKWLTTSGPDEGDELTGLLLSHLDALRIALPKMKQNHAIDDTELQTINSLRLWHKTENPATLDKIVSNIGKLDLPKLLVNEFKAEGHDAQPLLDELKTLVKKLTGTAGTHVKLDAVAAIREKKPAAWKEYLALRRELNLIYKSALRDVVRENNGSIDLKDVVKHLDRIGVPHQLPRGFDGKVGEDGNLLTKDGSPLKTATGGDVKNLDPNAKIVMNPLYDPKKDLVAGVKGNFVFKALLPQSKSGVGEPAVQYYYTGVKVLQSRVKKFALVEKLIAKEASISKRWRKDLLGSDLIKKILAVQCEIVYDTCARIGTVGNTNSNGKTQGLTTLMVGNVKKVGVNRVLDYIGKDSVHHRHVLKPETPFMREVIKVLDMLCTDEPRKSILWWREGKEFNANRLRQYFRLITGEPDATPHDLRHLRGTRLALTNLTLASERLAKRKSLTQSMVDVAFKDALTEVGRILGHVKGVGAEQKAVWSTAAKNYVAVEVMTDFYAKYLPLGIRTPSFLTKLKS